MNERSFILVEILEAVISVKGKNNKKYKIILEAAITIFAKNGFYQSTVSEIAKEAGVADGTIYLYFKNKDDILVQFFNYKTRQVFSAFKAEVEKTDDTVAKLENLVRKHLEEFQRDRNMAFVYQAVTHQKNPLVADKINEISKMYLDIVADIIEKGQQEGSIRKDIYLGLVKRFILGAVDTVINTWLYSGAKYDLTSMTDPLMDLFIRGIGNSEGGKSLE